MNKKTVLLVDPIHSAKYLSDSFKSHNIKTIALFSSMENIAEFNRPSCELFDEQIHINDEDLQTIIKLIGSDIDFVINGSDQHIELSEQIANILTPKYANKIETVKFRGSKYYQQLALQNHNLPTIQQIVFDCNQFDTTQLTQLTFPVFAKPANGGGSIGIFMAHNYEELILKLKNRPAMVNFENADSYLIHEYIRGSEIVIDSFSANGKHHISNVYSYTKDIIFHSPIYRTVENIGDENLRDAAISFAEKCLNACDFQFGFCHMELFYLGNNDFRMIELNPRVSGGSGFPNKMASELGLLPQDGLLAKFLNKESIPDFVVPKNKFAKVIFFYNHENIEFSCYPSYITHIDINKSPFELSERKAPDLTDLRKIILFSNDSQVKLDQDFESLRSKEIF